MAIKTSNGRTCKTVGLTTLLRDTEWMFKKSEQQQQHIIKAVTLLARALGI